MYYMLWMLVIRVTTANKPEQSMYVYVCGALFPVQATNIQIKWKKAEWNEDESQGL